MKPWPVKSLADVCDRVTDGSHRTPLFTEIGFPFVTVAHVDEEGRIDFDACERISETDFEELKRNDCRPLLGDVLFSKDGTVGKVAVIDFDIDFVVLSSLAILRPNCALLNQRFLAFALRSEPVLSQAINRKSGAAIRRIVLRDLKNIMIPVPPLAEQERIVKLLDEADKLRKLRAQADRRTAALIPALFHKMFGDPISNTMRWPCVSMQEVAAQDRYAIVDGPFGASLKQGAYRDSGVPVIRIKNITADGQFLDQDFLYIAEEKYEELKRSAVRLGDILVSRVGTIGNTCIYPGPHKKALLSTTGVCKITVDERRIDRVFLHSLMLTAPFQQQIKRSASSAVQPYFNLTALRNWRLVLPPLPLQKEFATHIAEIRSLEAEQAASRRRLDALFQSLLHSAFQGDL